jgi:uncharacterized protein
MAIVLEDSSSAEKRACRLPRQVIAHAKLLWRRDRGAPIDSVATISSRQAPAESRIPVASAIHTVGFLLILFGSAALMYFSANRMRAVEQPPRATFYITTIVWEWLLMGYVLFGVRRHGTPLRAVTGARWKSPKEFFRDVGIALVFWIIALPVLGGVAQLLHYQRMARSVRFLAPESSTEIILWIAVSVTAGICEETIFRGYLQKQLIAWTANVPAGVLLSAAAFGVGHIYQGAKATVVIGVYGLLFGILAQLRRSVRPGMMTHALHDSVSGLALRFLPK